jgi:hypothetical protein
MTCKVCEENLLEYLYGELDEAGRAGMEKHLAGSPACREALAGFRAVRAHAAELGQEEPPPGFTARILAHAAEHRERKRRRGWTWMLRPMLTAAVVAVVAVIVYQRSSPVYGPSEAARDRVEREVREETARPDLLAFRRAAPERQEGGPDAAEPLGKVIAGVRQPEQHAPVPRKELHLEAAWKSSEPGAEPERAGAPSPPPQQQDDRVGLRSPDPPAALSPADRDRPVPVWDEARLQPGRSRMAMADRAPGSRTPEEAGEMKAGSDAVPSAPLPETLARVRELAGAGRCREALALLEPLTSHLPGEKAAGPAWLETARCLLAGGDREEAERAALRAAAFPECARDAEAMLADLGLLPR